MSCLTYLNLHFAIIKAHPQGSSTRQQRSQLLAIGQLR